MVLVCQHLKHISENGVGFNEAVDAPRTNNDVAVETISCVKGLNVKNISEPNIFQFGEDDTEVKALVSTTAKHAAIVQIDFEAWPRYIVEFQCTYALENQGGCTHASGTSQGLSRSNGVMYIHGELHEALMCSVSETWRRYTMKSYFPAWALDIVFFKWQAIKIILKLFVLFLPRKDKALSWLRCTRFILSLCQLGWGPLEEAMAKARIIVACVRYSRNYC